MIRFIGGFLFWAKFGPGFVFLEGKKGLTYIKVWNCWNLIKSVINLIFDNPLKDRLKHKS